MLGNLGFILIGVGDVIVAGKHSTDTLAAVSLATAITNCILIFGVGIIATTSAILSNYRGEGKNAEKYFYPTLQFALFLACITCGIIMCIIPILDVPGFEKHLVPMIKDYFFITALSTFGIYLHCATKEYLQAFGIVKFPNFLTICCIFLNVGLNILFAFGYGIIPEMGAKGLALASLITRLFMGIVLLFYCYYKFDIKYEKISGYYNDLLKVGFPSSVAVMVAFAGFNSIALIMGRVSGIYAAAQNIVCTLTSVSFMIPLSISNATAVKVGFENGSRNWDSLKNYAYTGIIMSVSFMFCSAVIVAVFREFFIKLFTSDIDLIGVCVPIMYLIAFYQIFDGLQVTLSGIFRGLKQTKIVMFSNIISYWVIAVPLGCFLGLNFKLNLIGFWYALSASAVILCTIMFIVFRNTLKKMQT